MGVIFLLNLFISLVITKLLLHTVIHTIMCGILLSYATYLGSYIIHCIITFHSIMFCTVFKLYIFCRLGFKLNLSIIIIHYYIPYITLNPLNYPLFISYIQCMNSLSTSLNYTNIGGILVTNF